MSELPFDPFENTIPLEEAEDLTKKWRDFISPMVPSQNYIHAFYIPIADIDNLAEYHQAEAVRAYLCLVEPNDPSSAKIVIVPIDKRGNDITTITTPDGIVHSTVYDLTQPCPQACDFASPLYSSDVPPPPVD
jgi:hypothetical protein